MRKRMAGMLAILLVAASLLAVEWGGQEPCEAGLRSTHGRRAEMTAPQQSQPSRRRMSGNTHPA
jgi:hypothetical protein